MANPQPVTITIGTNAGAVNTRNFGTPIILAGINELNSSNFTERLRFYDSALAVAADTDLTTELRAALNAALAQSPRTTRIGVGRWDTGDLAADALDEIRAENDAWYGLTARSASVTVQGQISAWAETNKKLYFTQDSNTLNKTAATGSIIDTVRDAARKYTAAWWYEDNTGHLALSALASLLSVDLDSATTIAAFWNLSGITPSTLTTTERDAIEAANGNYYGTYGGLGVTFPGKTGSGAWVDQQLTLDWLEARANEAYARALVNATNRGAKIPYSSAGLQIIKGIMKAVLRQGEIAGHFLEGSTDAFITQIADVPVADRTSRTGRVTFKGVYQNAIQNIALVGQVVDADAA